MKSFDYWRGCISQAAEDCNLILTKEQLQCLSESVEISHNNYDMAFYSPPNSERLDDIEKEYKLKIKKMEKDFEIYKENAETAVKKALNLYSDSKISMGERGEVLCWGGRTERIQ